MTSSIAAAAALPPPPPFEFEAVPCMFKQRQEDGAEVGMFGYLIRPSSSEVMTAAIAAPAGGGGTAAVVGKQPPSPSNSPPSASDQPTAVPTSTLAAGTSSVQIVPGQDAKKEQPKASTRPPSFAGPQMIHQLKGGSAPGQLAFLAPPGMPPILPRPKRGGGNAQKTMAPGTGAMAMPLLAARGTAHKVVVPITPNAIPASASGNGTAVEKANAQSPSQVVPQIGTGAGQVVDVLSIATASTSSSAGSSTSSSSSPATNSSSPSSSNGLLAIQQSTAQPKIGEKQEKRGGTKEEKQLEKAPAKRRRQKQQQEKQKEAEKVQHQQQQNNSQAEQQQGQHGQQGEGMLGEDLHCIDLSQLVNSTVITTEDYLSSQSEPIYTNMEMFNSVPGPSSFQPMPPSMQRGGHQQLHSQPQHPSHAHPQQQHHFMDSQSIPVSGHQQQQPCPSTSSGLCHSAILRHNQQHSQQQLTALQRQQQLQQQQHFLASSSSGPQVHFLGPLNNGQGLAQQQAVQAQYSAPGQPSLNCHQSAVSSNSSSQPPPTAGWHPYLVAHPGGSHISSTPDSGIQSIDGSPPSVYTPPMVSPYGSQVRSCESVGATHSGNNGTFLLSANNSSGVHHPPNSCYPQMCPSTGLLITAPPPMAMAPPRLIGHLMVGGGGGLEMDGTCQGGEEEEDNDFSDMPKLVPVTHMDHDEALESEDSREQPQRGVEDGNGTARQLASAAGTTPTKAAPSSAGGGDVFFHQGMSLQQLAECISSSMPPEQLKQLTSLIQSKAAEVGGAGTGEKKQEVERKSRKEKERRGTKPREEVPSAAASQREREKKPKKPKAGEEEGKEQNNNSKMVTSRQPNQLKTKCQNLTPKLHSKEPRPSSSSAVSNPLDHQQARESENSREEEEKQRIVQVAAFRQQVQAQLSRKLEAFTESVYHQLEGTRLDIHAEYWQKPRRAFPLGKPDWEEVEKRLERNRQMEKMAQKVPRKRGRKRKEERKEEEKHEEKLEEKPEQKQEKKREEKHGRKRRTEDEAESSREGHRKRRRRDREEAEEGEREEKPEMKQKTPPIILKLSSLLRRNTHGKKNHTALPAALPSSSNASRKQQKQQQTSAIASRCSRPSTSSSSRPTAGRAQMPPSPALSPEQLAIIRRGHCFLPRNLRKGRKGTNTNGLDGTWREEEGKGRSATAHELPDLLRQLFAQFSATSLRKARVPRRQVRQLERAVQMLLSSTHQSASLLDQFDVLLKQFIADSRNSKLQNEYLLLKRKADSSRLQPQLQKEQLQMFTEDRRRSLHPQPHQPICQPSSSSSSPTKKPCPNTQQQQQQRQLTVDTCMDLSYMDSPDHPVGRWDPDKEARLSPNSDNRDQNCVRCICGMAEEDGVMTQCDRCNFWLHADCLDSAVQEDQEFVCDFCTHRLDTTPRVDIVQKPQPKVKYIGCSYHRTLVNARGLQIRLNEAVYVEMLINDKHKKILRELHEECVRKQPPPGTPGPGQQSPVKGRQGRGRQKGLEGGQKPSEEEDAVERVPNRWWTEEEGSAERKEFHRRELRIFRVERLFIGPYGRRFIFGCYYARPHETFCDSSRKFVRNELFWTPLFDTLPLDAVVGRCLILEPQIWTMGRPKSPRYLEEDVYVCEYKIDRNQRSFEKIQPRDHYYINTEPYVFNKFGERLKMKRDFTPFQLANESTEGNGTGEAQHPKRTAQLASAIWRQLFQQRLDGICQRLGQRRGIENDGTDQC